MLCVTLLMPGGGGLAAIRQIVQTSPHIRILVVTMGADNEAIARQLSFSPKTVRNYVSNIFSKLQVADQAQAVVKARQVGLE